MDNSLGNKNNCKKNYVFTNLEKIVSEFYK